MAHISHLEVGMDSVDATVERNHRVYLPDQNSEEIGILKMINDDGSSAPDHCSLSDQFSRWCSRTISACNSKLYVYCNKPGSVWERFKPRSKEMKVVILVVAFFALSYLAVRTKGCSIMQANFSEQFQNCFRLHNSAERPDLEKEKMEKKNPLEVLLERAALPNKTVIIASLNSAWAQKDTMIDLFLESFQRGNGTSSLLKHLIIVGFDQTAFDRCKEIHEHCWKIETPGVDFSQEELYMSADFVKMMWRRIQFLETVLQKGYSFVFTDADILWLRNPFPMLEEAHKDQNQQGDMAIASDYFNGNESDLVGNFPNSGFVYARASNRTSKAYSYWYEAKERYPGMKEQDVFSAIKNEEGFMAIGLRLRFLDTQLFAGFCSIKGSDKERVITMHANCCKGLNAKLFDLRAVLHSWKLYLTRPPLKSVPLAFESPSECPKSWN